MVQHNTTKELETLIREVMLAVASSKTMKYFIGYIDEKKEDKIRKGFDEYLKDVVTTLEAIRGTDASSITVEEGDSYLVKEYHIPKVLLDYVNSGRIYASTDAIGKKEPIFKAERKEAKLSPLQFNRFFDSFNQNQSDGYKITVVDNWDRKFTTLEEIQFLEDEDGLMLKLHETGFDIYTCDLIGISLNGLSDYLTKYEAPTIKGYESWLLS